MAIGDRSHNVLMNLTGVSGVQTGNWYSVQMDARAQIAFVFSLIAGTATFVLEGRNDPADTPVQLATGSASAKALVEKFHQFRVRLTAATGAQVVASIPAALIQAS